MALTPGVWTRKDVGNMTDVLARAAHTDYILAPIVDDGEKRAVVVNGDARLRHMIGDATELAPPGLMLAALRAWRVIGPEVSSGVYLAGT
jgi:hypothetical protein